MLPVIVHVPLLVVSVSPSVAVPVTAGATGLTGAGPPPVGGPPALPRIPTSRPSLPPSWLIDPEVSLNPAQVVGFVAPVNVALPLMFGEVAPENRLFVFVVSDPDTTFGPCWLTLLVYVSPLGDRSPVLVELTSSVVLVHGWMFGPVEHPDGSAPPACCGLWLTTEPVSAYRLTQALSISKQALSVMVLSDVPSNAMKHP